MPLFHKLSSVGNDDGIFHGISIVGNPAYGKCTCICIHETDGAYPSWSSRVYRWYRIDSGGITKLDDNPYLVNGEHLQAVIFSEMPKIKLTHSNDCAEFNLALGPEWFVQCSVKITNGMFDELVKIKYKRIIE